MNINKWKWRLVFVLALLNFVVCYFVYTGTQDGNLEVSFLNVGQGDSIFIESPNGNQMLIDGGDVHGGILRRLSERMPFYDKFIDVVIATHPDKDHIGGLVDVLKNFQVGIVLDNGLFGGGDAYDEVERIIREKKIKNIVARRGQKIILDEGVTFTILFPDRDVTGVEDNTASIIGRLVYGDHEFLLTADAPDEIEKYLVQIDGKNLESDVLKAGHHGSKTSTSEEFLGYVSPKYVVISSGEDNSYGHPHKDVILRLARFETIVLRTDELGTITFISNGRELEIK